MKRILVVVLAVLLGLGTVATAYAAEVTTCTVTAETVVGVPGETVRVSVEIKDNPGFTNFAIGLTCGEGLTLKSIETQDDSGAAYLCGEQVSTNLQWKAPETEAAMGYVVCAAAAPVKMDGTLFTATFEVAEGVTGEWAVTPTVVYIRNNEAAFPVFEPIIASVTPGSVFSVLFGDVTGDGMVEYDDVVRAYQASLPNGPALTPGQMAAVDRNGDGNIDQAEYKAIYTIYTGGTVE